MHVGQRGIDRKLTGTIDLGSKENPFRPVVFNRQDGNSGCAGGDGESCGSLQIFRQMDFPLMGVGLLKPDIAPGTGGNVGRSAIGEGCRF